MKVRVNEIFGEKRQFEFEASDWEQAYSKAMKLVAENNNKIKDEYYYQFTILEQ